MKRLTVRHHVIDVHDPTARKRILRVANKDILQVNVSEKREGTSNTTLPLPTSTTFESSPSNSNTGSGGAGVGGLSIRNVKSYSDSGIRSSRNLIGGVFGECEHALPSCSGAFITIEVNHTHCLYINKYNHRICFKKSSTICA